MLELIQQPLDFARTYVAVHVVYHMGARRLRDQFLKALPRDGVQIDTKDPNQALRTARAPNYCFLPCKTHLTASGGFTAFGKPFWKSLRSRPLAGIVT